MGRTPATLAVIVILGVLALAAARYAAEAARPAPATKEDDMLLLKDKPAVKLDETPRDAAGRPLHLETATFALG